MKKIYNWICARIFGLGYIVNFRSSEIHKYPFHSNCHINLIKDKKRISENSAQNLIGTHNKMNGCRWCWAEENDE